MAKKFPDMEVAEEFEGLSFQQRRTVEQSVRLNIFDDCLGRKIAAACPNEE